MRFLFRVYEWGYALDSRDYEIQYTSMEDYPRTILEFEERFATEKGCFQCLIDFLAGWIFLPAMWP